MKIWIVLLWIRRKHLHREWGKEMSMWCTWNTGIASIDILWNRNIFESCHPIRCPKMSNSPELFQTLSFSKKGTESGFHSSLAHVKCNWLLPLTITPCSYHFQCKCTKLFTKFKVLSFAMIDKFNLIISWWINCWRVLLFEQEGKHNESDSTLIIDIESSADDDLAWKFNIEQKSPFLFSDVKMDWRPTHSEILGKEIWKN